MTLHASRMEKFIFSCPTTDLLVQLWLNDNEEEGRRENRYEPISCPACVRLHFLNRKSGKLLGHDCDAPVNRS